MDLERLVDELWRGNHGLGDVSRFSSRAPQRRKRSKSRVLEIPSGKIVGWTAQAIAPGGRKGWPSASPRTFAWSTRAYHERQQTISHRRYFVACRGRDWPLKTASTCARHRAGGATKWLGSIPRALRLSSRQFRAAGARWLRGRLRCPSRAGRSTGLPLRTSGLSASPA